MRKFTKTFLNPFQPLRGNYFITINHPPQQFCAETLLINLISWRLPSVYLFDRSGPFVGTYSASGTFLSIWDFQALADLGIGIAGFPSQYSKFSPFSAQCPVGLIVPVSSPVPEKRTGTGIFQPSKILGKHCSAPLLFAYTLLKLNFGLPAHHWSHAIE